MGGFTVSGFSPSASSSLGALSYVLGSLIALALFDFYAFSPRPSGIAMRSRRLLPIMMIGLSVIATLVSLYHISSPQDLIANGANYAPKAAQAERWRLLMYPFVVSSNLQSLTFGMTVLASGFCLSSVFGLLGWVSIAIAIALSAGLTFVHFWPTGLHAGPVEFSIGLMMASVVAVTIAIRHYALGQERRAQPRFKSPSQSPSVLLVGFLIFGVVSAMALMILSPLPSPFLIVAAALAGTGSAYFYSFLRKLSGPHWERTTLVFITTIAVFVLTGFGLYFSPKGFDREGWQQLAQSTRKNIDGNLRLAMNPAKSPTADSEIRFAQQLEHSANQIKQVTAIAEREESQGRVLSQADRDQLNDLRVLDRLFRILERLHRSRALIIEANQRTQNAFMRASDPSDSDPLYSFWKEHRPWIDAELMSLQTFAPQQAENYRPFVLSLDRDLNKVTQAAFEVEIRRVDVWVGWANRQPKIKHRSIKGVAMEQAARLKSLSLTAKTMHIPQDPRLHLLGKDLRRIAAAAPATSGRAPARVGRTAIK